MSQRDAIWQREMTYRALMNATAGSLRTSAAWLCVLCIPACSLDVRDTACRAKCQQQLMQIHGALTEYVRAHGDIPRDARGAPSLAKLHKAGSSPRDEKRSVASRCPGAAQSECGEYVMNPRLRADDLTLGSSTVVACDRCSNHSSGCDGKFVTVALLAHGTTVLMFLPEAEQAEWRKLFSEGDEKAAVVKIVEEQDGTESVMWYLGQEKGYVKAH